MTLLFMDGFEHYATADLSGKWDFRGGTFEELGSSYGRFGTNGIRLYAAGAYLRKLISGSKSTIYFGGAFYKASTGATSETTGSGMFRVYDESQVLQVIVRLDPSYGFSVYRGDGTLLGSSSPGLVGDRQWHYLEVKVTISDTVGVVEVKLDESQIINLTSRDTRNGSEYIGYVQISGEIINKYFYWDDIYIDDSQFQGNCHVKAFMPDSNGTYTDFTRSVGSNDYEAVDANPPDDDTDYIYSSTDEDKSTFGITTGSLETVKGMQLNNRLLLANAGVRTVKPVVRSNGTDYIGGVFPTIISTPLFYSRIYETDPDDSGAWTQTKLEAAEFGLKIES